MVTARSPKVLTRTFTASKPKGRKGIGTAILTTAPETAGALNPENSAVPLPNKSPTNGEKKEEIGFGLEFAGFSPMRVLPPKNQGVSQKTGVSAQNYRGVINPDDPTDLEEAVPNVEAFLASAQGSTSVSEPPKKKARRTKAVFGKSPWPDHPHPTPEECAEVNRLLTLAHGPSARPEKLVVNNSVSGCGEVPCVLDALLRTILSLNTTTLNSGRAFQGLIARFGLIPTEVEVAASDDPNSKKRKYPGSGAGSVDWDAVRLGDVKDLEQSIKAGGLQAKKAMTIKQILDQVWEEGKQRMKAKCREDAVKRIAARRATARTYDSGSELSELEDDSGDYNGELTLDHLHEFDNIALLDKLTSFSGIGYKAASCVMLFSLGRNIFPVDTHVHRLTKFLEWVPESATEVTGFFHLDVKIPDEYKYSLHNQLIRHGRMCKHCKGGPETKPRDPNAKPKVKEEPEPELDENGNPIKAKRTRKVWIGNGLMKEVVVEVDTEDETVELDDGSCILEGLMKRIRKARRAPVRPKKEPKGEGGTDTEAVATQTKKQRKTTVRVKKETEEGGGGGAAAEEKQRKTAIRIKKEFDEEDGDGAGTEKVVSKSVTRSHKASIKKETEEDTDSEYKE